MKNLYKTTVVTDDGDIELEAYTDGSYWNGWANVVFTAEQLSAWLNPSPYDFRIVNDGVIIYFEDEEKLPLVTFTDESGTELTGYDMAGYCFIFTTDL